MERIRYEVTGRVARIGLGRPEKRNAFNLQMLRELAQAFTDYEDDSEVWCALLYAEGEHFTGGLELNEVGRRWRTGRRSFRTGWWIRWGWGRGAGRSRWWWRCRGTA
ncbi:MAG: enoyl-CoA hydratase-related protein [Polyangiaceae bacterium]